MYESEPIVVDTLTQAYADRWEGTAGLEEASFLMKWMSSNDLIFVVLGVSLIIWFVLLWFIIRVDKKVSKIEESVNKTENEA